MKDAFTLYDLKEASVASSKHNVAPYKGIHIESTELVGFMMADCYCLQLHLPELAKWYVLMYLSTEVNPNLLFQSQMNVLQKALAKNLISGDAGLIEKLKSVIKSASNIDRATKFLEALKRSHASLPEGCTKKNTTNVVANSNSNGASIVDKEMFKKPAFNLLMHQNAPKLAPDVQNANKSTGTQFCVKKPAPSTICLKTVEEVRVRIDKVDDSKRPLDSLFALPLKKKKVCHYGTNDIDVRKADTWKLLSNEERLDALLEASTLNSSELTNTAQSFLSKWAKPVSECLHKCHGGSKTLFMDINPTIREFCGSNCKFECGKCKIRKHC